MELFFKWVKYFVTSEISRCFRIPMSMLDSVHVPSPKFSAEIDHPGSINENDSRLLQMEVDQQDQYIGNKMDKKVSFCGLVFTQVFLEGGVFLCMFLLVLFFCGPDICQSKSWWGLKQRKNVKKGKKASWGANRKKKNVVFCPVFSGEISGLDTWVPCQAGIFVGQV